MPKAVVSCIPMKPSLPRRAFLTYCGQFSAACVLCSVAQPVFAEEGAPAKGPAKKLPELKDLAYCGLICGKQCEMWNATKSGDVAAKKAVYEKWKWKEKFGVDFDPDKVFCHGCKAPRNACEYRPFPLHRSPMLC